MRSARAIGSSKRSVCPALHRLRPLLPSADQVFFAWMRVARKGSLAPRCQQFCALVSGCSTAAVSHASKARAAPASLAGSNRADCGSSFRAHNQHALVAQRSSARPAARCSAGSRLAASDSETVEFPPREMPPSTVQTRRGRSPVRARCRRQSGLVQQLRTRSASAGLPARHVSSYVCAGNPE